MIRSVSLALACAVVALAAPCAAETGAVDVTLKLPPPPHRALTLEWGPLALLVGKVSFDAVLVPGSHHALVLSPFYASSSTAPISVYDAQGNATALPTQTFSGVGGELGYRYYFGEQGPRGFFLGASLLVGAFDAKAQDGTSTSFWNLGGALDVGFQAIVAERVSLTLGAGAQLTTTTTTLPSQQFPADVYANGGIRPRVLASLGYAFF